MTESKIKFHSGKNIPLEMHKVRIIQKLTLLPVEERAAAMEKAGFNTFLLNNKDVYLDMLTDSGVNAMSDRQQAAMLTADDSYAGSETFNELHEKIKEIFNTEYFLPAHQGRAAENIVSQYLVKEGQIVPMNYHFTTSKAHIDVNGGRVEELVIDEGIQVTSDHLFKGNMDIDKLKACVEENGKENIAYVRMEAGTNLIGGQPFSVANLREVRQVCEDNGLILVLDASLLQDNLYFNKVREEEFKDASIHDIALEITNLCDIVYFSARKLGFVRGGGIITKNEEHYNNMRELVTLYEGFLTYGGMSVREMAALTVGLDETMDFEMINQGPQFIEYMTDQLLANGVPVVTPAGGLGCHIDAMRFVDHLDQSEYPAGALAAAIYIASGARGMERGTMSEERQEDGSERFANMELVRMAMPRRVFTLSQVDYIVDRITWLYENRELIGGIKYVEEPSVMRFFFGTTEATSNWVEKLVAKFREDFGDSL